MTFFFFSSSSSSSFLFDRLTTSRSLFSLSLSRLSPSLYTHAHTFLFIVSQSSILGINYQTNEVYNFEEYYAYPENMYLVNIEKEDGFEVLLIDGPNVSIPFFYFFFSSFLSLPQLYILTIHVSNLPLQNRNVTWTTATEGKDCVSGPIGSDDEMKGLYNSTTHHLNHLKLRDPNMDGTFVYGGVTKSTSFSFVCIGWCSVACPDNLAFPSCSLSSRIVSQSPAN